METNFDPRFDAYIAKASAFAQPVLIHLRQLIHQTVPGVLEVMKWGHPHFDYKGGPFMGIAAFKQHLGVNFWKAQLMDDPHGVFKEAEKHSAGNLGKISSLADLPADEVLIAYIRNAAQLNAQGIKAPQRKPAEPKKELEVPADLIDAFKTHTAAMQHFQQFSPSAKREYLEWLYDAKSEATRAKRLETMLEWVAEGKTRNWKYKK